MKYFAAILLLFCITATVSAQNDCPEALIICGNSGYQGLTATGPGTQELIGRNDCSSAENHSIWLELNIKVGGTLGFILTPESDALIVDYDFFMYGPDVPCDSIGHAVRCSTTNPLMAGSDSNITGMNDIEPDIAEGPGPDGNNFINWITVQSGEKYFLVIDRPVGESNFSIEWIGTAQFHPIPEFLNPNNISINLEKCDVDGDQTDVFDLTEHLAMFLGSQTNVVVTYHESQNDATVNTGLITNLGNYQNTSNPHTIYMRMTNTVTGCFNTESFDLVINALPIFNNPQNISIDIEECDADGNNDGVFAFDLTQHETMLAGGQDVLVTYHENLSDVSGGTGQITNLTAYNNTSNPQTIYMRMKDNVTGCVSTSSFNIFVKNPPLFNNPQNILLNLTECGTDALGHTAVFNLAQHSAMLTNGQPELQLTYHKNFLDATSGDAAITNLGAYTNTSNPQQVFMRMYDTVSGCAATAVFDIEALPWPTFNNPTGISLDLEVCDNDGADDNSAAFNLTQYEAMLKGAQSNAILTWHKTQDDANTNINWIDDPAAYHNVTNPQTIYMRMTNTVTECYDTGSFEIKIKDKPVYHNPQNISLNQEVCDTDGNKDGVFLFDLTKHAPMLLGGETDVLLTWHDDFNNAVAGNGAIISPGNYVNISNPQNIYMRLVNTVTGCISIKPFEIKVNALPVFNNPAGTPVVIEACDLHSFGDVAVFDLTQKETMLKGSQSQMAFSYYENQADALSGSNAIPSPTAFNNTSNPQTIYMRMVNTVTGCHTTSNLDIQVLDMPLFNNPQDISILLNECDTDGTDDQFTLFDLTRHTAMFIDSQTNVAITYYTNLADALAGTQAINNPTAYTNLQNPQDIYMRMENTNTGCFNNAMFSIRVNSLPYFNNPGNDSLKLEECDSDAVDDKSYVFDLTTYAGMLTTGQPFTSISYFERPSDAATGNNAITNTTSYRNTTNPQTIYTRIADSFTGCFDTGSFEIEVVEVLDAGEPHDLELCDLNGNGHGVFNLALNDAPLKNGNTATSVRYYRTQYDAENEISQLPLLYQNRVAYQAETIWARLENTGGCFGHDVKSFTLNIIPLPDIVYSVNVTDFNDHENTIAVIMNDAQDYEFSLDGATFTNDVIFTNLDPGLYTLYIRAKNECKTVEQEVIIMQYPKFFTPNGDGVNETWTVPYLYRQPKANVTIFDRYGKTITYFNGNAKGWDGQYNGAALPATDYWFVLELEDGRVIKAHFSMLR